MVISGVLSGNAQQEIWNKLPGNLLQWNMMNSMNESNKFDE